MDKVSHKGTSNYCFHCWYFHRVSLRGFAQRRTVHPGRQDLLGSLLFPASGPQNSRDPRRGGKAEIPQMIFSPCRWAQREHWSPGMASRSQTQSLSPSARHNAFTATPQPYFDCEVWNLLSSNLNWRSRGPSCNPWQFTSLTKYLLEKFYAILKKTALELHLQWKMLCIRTGFEIERLIIIL